jgi:hypothetical protein
LKQIEAKPPQVDPRIKSHLERAAGLIAKAHESLGRSTDAKAAEDATDSYDGAMAEVASAPGLPSLKVQLIAFYASAVQSDLSRHDIRHAQKLLAAARKRGWSSTELSHLAAGIPHTAPPAAKAGST